ncbi:MAG: hypothetical protein FWB93_06570, partial [Oscillospiraceae bacterium]|nr:hypothetical protein [Oscillospiraceae bacterium]
MKKTLAIIIAVALLLVGCAAVHNNDPAPENEDAVLPTPPPQSYNYTQPNIAHGMYTIFLADTPLGLAKTDGQPTLTAVYAEESTFQPAYFAISVAQMYPYEYYIIQLGDNPDYTLTATVSGETSMVFLTQTVQGLQEQMWRIHDNDDGSFSFILHGADNFRLLFDAGVFRITNVVYEDYENDENDYAPAENDENGYSNGVVTSNFSLVLSATVSPARFVQHISEYGNVILNLGRDIQEQA